MGKFKVRFWLFVVTVLAFFLPFGAIITIEQGKRVEKISAELQAYAAAQEAARQAALEREQAIAAERQQSRQDMQQAKAQYETLLRDQAGAIAAHQSTQTTTVNEPIVVQQPAPKPASTTTTSKPKSTRTTKTS